MRAMQSGGGTQKGLREQLFYVLGPLTWDDFQCVETCLRGNAGNKKAEEIMDDANWNCIILTSA